MLFDAGKRHDHRTLLAGESLFAFLDRSAWPSCENIRNFVNAELMTFPEAERSQLLRRFRDGEAHDFHSAMFELLLWGGLTRRGYRLIPHPDLGGSRASRPDFHVTTPSGQAFFLEARLATVRLESDQESAEALRETVLAELGRDDHPHFRLWWEDSGRPSAAPSGKKLRRAVRQWLDGLDAEQVLRAFTCAGADACPTMQWPVDEALVDTWQVSLTALPRQAFNNLPFVVNGLSGGGWVDRIGPLQRALKKKATHYGKLDLPLVVAVNVRGIGIPRIDEVHALFGDCAQYVPGSVEARLPDPPRGFWHDGSAPKRQTLSAAWIFDGLEPMNLSRARSTLYFNPWSRRAVPDDLTSLPHAAADGHILRWRERASFGAVFGFPAGWPDALPGKTGECQFPNQCQSISR
jgi:hypothetical protein